MKAHFELGINVKKLLEDFKPQVVLELGALVGTNTEQLLSMDSFDLITISAEPFKIEHPKLTFIQGISYIEIPKLNRQVDVAIIDTDHNYWTIMKELDALMLKMPERCIIMAHDTVSFGIKDGKGGVNVKTYADNKTPYPRDEIVASPHQGLWNAMTHFVSGSDFSIIAESKEHSGAMAIGRGL